ncbi:MAG: NADH-quinone oxidoreductase subunit N [Bacteroidetes bacterium]|nr:NADH-quinone oxidoreductase subunit N [Bacteroidota bacterium]
MNSLIIIAALGILSMLAEIFNFKKVLPFIVGGGLVLALGNVIFDYMQQGSYYDDRVWFTNFMHWDKFSMAFTGVLIATALLWFCISGSIFSDEKHATDNFAVILFSLCGAIVMVSFADLTMLFIGIEILSISMYIMAAGDKFNLASNESAFKYFLMGSFATGFLLFGIALTYGTCGTFNIYKIGEYLAANVYTLPSFFQIGLILLLVGLFFKVAAVPFHFWAPDVYQGAPTTVTAYMSTIVKTAAFAAFFRLFNVSFISVHDKWIYIVMTVSVLSMLLGNILAIQQTSLKRVLAYSGIAHAGYMLMAVAASNGTAQKALLLYATAYSIAGVGMFAIIHFLQINNHINDSYDSLKGFAARNPFIAACISILTLSMAGIPPVAGFMGKYYMFLATIHSGYVWLALFGVVSSLIGVYYYLRIIISMYSHAGKTEAIQLQTYHKIFFAIVGIVSLILGIFPFLITDLV